MGNPIDIDRDTYTISDLIEDIESKRKVLVVSSTNDWVWTHCWFRDSKKNSAEARRGIRELTEKYSGNYGYTEIEIHSSDADWFFTLIGNEEINMLYSDGYVESNKCLQWQEGVM